MAQGNFLTGYPGQAMALPTKTQQQQNLLNDYLGQAQKQLGQSSPSFEPIQQAANRNYAQQAVPNLSAFLASQGVEPGGSASDAAYKGAYNDFQLKSLAQRSQFEQGQQANLNNMVNTGLGTQSFENIYQPPQQGFASAAAPGVAAAGTGFALNKLDQWMNPQQQSGVGQQVASNVAGTAAGAAAGTALGVGGKAAAATVGGLGAKLGAGALATLASPWFWIPVAVAGLAAGTYYVYNHYKNKWETQKLSDQQAAQMKEEGLKKQQTALAQQQGQPSSIANRLQQFASPNFATQGA
jgi:hypothetical protein